MKIQFDFTRRQERPLIVGFQAEGHRYVELREDTTTPSLLETIAHIAGATVDGLVAQADPILADSSVVALVIRGMTKYYQRQMLVRSLASMDELLSALKYVTAPDYKAPDEEAKVSRGDDCGTHL
ncbi:hypothetical protein MTO96_039537 [Rhipicephalus appendiculatus]